MGNTGSTMNSILTNEDKEQRSNDKLKEPFITEVGDNLDLDQVHRSTDKLTHPAAERAKAPKRRLPSNVSMICYSLYTSFLLF